MVQEGARLPEAQGGSGQVAGGPTRKPSATELVRSRLDFWLLTYFLAPGPVTSATNSTASA